MKYVEFENGIRGIVDLELNSIEDAVEFSEQCQVSIFTENFTEFIPMALEDSDAEFEKIFESDTALEGLKGVIIPEILNRVNASLNYSGSYFVILKGYDSLIEYPPKTYY